jgi:F-type H+-transporting ATPase subunit b
MTAGRVTADSQSHKETILEQRGWALSKWNDVRFVLPLLLLYAVLVGPLDAFASEGHAAPRWGDFGWRVLNFVIFAGILWYFLGDLTKRFFRNRREGIKNSLDELESQRASAKEKLADVEQRIANLDAEREAILDESRQQAEALKQEIIKEAHRQAEQIVEQARLTAENEGRAIFAEVRAAIADEVVDATEKILRDKLRASDHDKLIAKSLKKVVLH